MTNHQHRRVLDTARTLFVAGLCAVLLTACPDGVSGPRPIASGGPGGLRLIEHPGEIPGLPPSVGPFRRSHAIAYRPGERDFSVAYQIGGSSLEAASTVYFYARDLFPPGRLRSLEGQFADSDSSLVRSHPGAVLVEHSRITVTQGGAPVDGLWSVYRLEMVFDGRRRSLASEVAVFVIDDHFVKFRQSYPWEDRADLGPQTADLMRRLDWSDPAAVTDYLLSL